MEKVNNSDPSVSRSRVVNLDIALLRTFVAAVELGGIGKAAERVGRSQPAISLQLKRLEELGGQPLFIKKGRGIELTDSGDVLLGYARKLLELNDETVSAATNLTLSGNIRLGISQDFAEGWLTTVLARFSRAHTSTLIEVRADRNATLRDALSRKEIDFALIFGYADQANSVDLGDVPMAWVGLKKGLWRQESQIPLVVFDPPCEFRQIAVNTLEKHDRPWRLAFTSPSLSSQWSALEAGLGVTVRTPIGLRPSLSILGEKDGLPPLPENNLRLLLLRAEEHENAASIHLRDTLVDTMREKLRTDLRFQPHS